MFGRQKRSNGLVGVGEHWLFGWVLATREHLKLLWGLPLGAVDEI